MLKVEVSIIPRVLHDNEYVDHSIFERFEDELFFKCTPNLYNPDWQIKNYFVDVNPLDEQGKLTVYAVWSAHLVE